MASQAEKEKNPNAINTTPFKLSSDFIRVSVVVSGPEQTRTAVLKGSEFKQTLVKIACIAIKMQRFTLQRT